MQVIDGNGRLKVEVTNFIEELTIGVTTITGGVSGRALYDNAGVLGELDLASIYVPLTRTLTINGTTQDLSADRTFTVSTGITIGTTAITSGTVGRVLFEGTGNVVQESANLFWDNTNGRLGVGTSTPSKALTIQANANDEGILLRSATGLPLFQVTRDGASNNTAELFQYASGAIRLAIRSTTNFSYFNGGNFGFGTTTDAGYKLDVNGTARVKGASNVSTTTAFTIANSDSTNLLQVQDNGYIRIGSQATSAFRVYATDVSGDSEPSGLNLVLNSRVSSQTQGFNLGMVTISGPTATATTGIQNVFLISKAFSPTSGTATYAASSIIPTINQTGGANGITRGLYIAPTLTSAFDFRAIETTRGNVVFGNLPTSPAGLPTGAIWNNLGILSIV